MPRPSNAEQRRRAATRASVLTILVNVTLTAARTAAGLLAGSAAVLADAVNSGTDILATLVVLGGSRIAARPADEDHPYGHEKAEPVAAKLVGILVTVTGVITTAGAFRALQGGGAEPVGLLAAWVTGGSILIKEVLARYLFRVGQHLGNPALEADAANQRTDVLASTAVLAGALGGRFGLPWLDPVMGILVGGLIVRMGLKLYWESVTHLMDPAPEPETMERIAQVIESVPGVQALDELKARLFGAGVYVDCKIAVDGQLTVAEGHAIAGRVKARVLEAIPEVLDVLVHVNPHPAEQAEDAPLPFPYWGAGLEQNREDRR